MNDRRRQALKTGAGLGTLGALVAAGVITAAEALAQDWKTAFETRSLPDTLKALGGTTAADSKDITITAPDIAENGAVVPVAVASTIPNTESIAILVEKNPNMLAASFSVPAGTETSVGTRVKMGQTSNVLALVKADGKFFVATKEIKVTLGGCGG
ncbi:MAG: thiosulfate oxidation carrier protein SoxY [Betaproteobacteria bacterium]